MTGIDPVPLISIMLLTYDLLLHKLLSVPINKYGGGGKIKVGVAKMVIVIAITEMRLFSDLALYFS